MFPFTEVDCQRNRNTQDEVSIEDVASFMMGFSCFLVKEQSLSFLKLVCGKAPCLRPSQSCVTKQLAMGQEDDPSGHRNESSSCSVSGQDSFVLLARYDGPDCWKATFWLRALKQCCSTLKLKFLGKSCLLQVDETLQDFNTSGSTDENKPPLIPISVCGVPF